MSDSTLEAEIAALKKAGRFEEAAERLLSIEKPRAAAELFAAVWNFERAISIATEHSEFGLAYTYALEDDRQRANIPGLLKELFSRPSQAREAIAVAIRKGREDHAGELYEALGEVDEAARFFEAASEFSRAAAIFEEQGEYRKAGVLYERALNENPNDSAAALRLARILAAFSRYDAAARALQSAMSGEAEREEAGFLLVACFDAMGHAHAAGEVLDRLRASDPTLPTLVGEALEARFGAREGSRVLAAQAEGEELLGGRYVLKETLGEGANGKVVRALDRFYDREVAIKILKITQSGAQGRDAYSRFAKEARIAAGIDHPHVVDMIEFNADGPYLVMELMEGGTLDAMLHQRIRLSSARQIARGILSGLEAVHRRGVIHRDIKPANVFFGATGDVKIGDFGVAHLQDLGKTLTGAMLGTLAYMAPEQITGSEAPSAATDLYAFGCVLYQVLTGQLPYPGPDFMSQHLSESIPKVSSIRPELERFDALIASLLQKAPEARPKSPTEVLEKIAELDWTDPDHDALQELIEDVEGIESSQRISSIPPPAPTDDRYVPLDAPAPFGWSLARDTRLERNVFLVPMDARLRQRYQVLAQIVHPHVQAVFDLDDVRELAILEAPTGGPISSRDRGRFEVAEQLQRALEEFSERGFVHGEIGIENLWTGDGRAVLLLPSNASAEPDLEKDRVALIDALRSVGFR